MIDVQLSNTAEKQYKKLDPSYRERVDQVIDTLETEPVPNHQFDLKKIKGMEGVYRIRISSYRVTYQWYKSENRIRIESIARRDEHTYG